MNFYALGVPFTVVVDDYIPYYIENGVTVLPFGRINDDDAIWSAILEKIFAKFHGNYQHLNTGNSTVALRSITGAPSETHRVKDNTDMTEDSLWSLVYQNDQAHNVMTFGTAGGASANDERSASGLVLGHVYTLLGAKELSNGQKLIKCRNPWSKEEYTGAYKDSDPIWDTASTGIPNSTLKDEVDGFVNANDGVFYMPVDLFKAEVYEMYVTYHTEGWSYAKFLRLNDTGGQAGAWDNCGASCTRHNLKLKNDHSSSQTVYLSAHTWQHRPYPSDCKTYARDTRHSIYNNKDNTKYNFLYGDMEVDPMTLQPDEEVDIIVEFDFTSATTSDKDWSVVAWAPSGPISITHNDGLSSDDFAVIDKADDASAAAAIAQQYAAAHGEGEQQSANEA